MKLEKVTRCALSVLLAGFVCLSPTSLVAFAEESPENPEANELHTAVEPTENGSEEALTGETVSAGEEASAGEEVTGGDETAEGDEAIEGEETVKGEEAIGNDAVVEEAADEEASLDEAATSSETTAIDDADGQPERLQAEEPQVVADEPVAQDATAFMASAVAMQADVVASTAAADDASDVLSVASADELKAAFASVPSNGSAAINITADFTITDQGNDNALMVPATRTITILGNGHTVTYASNAASNGALGARGGVLNLGDATGNPLTITSGGANAGASLIHVATGVVNMYDGVAITDQVGTGIRGGAVNVTGGTFNMHGGVIDGCTATIGGGVYVAGATMLMDGDAVISNCTVSNSDSNGGAGIYLDANASLTMSGNAAITGCAAPTQFGGGVFINSGATMAMEDSASIVGNSAKRAGGVVNYGGTFTGGTIYNNSASADGDDFFNYNGTFTLNDIANSGLTLASNGAPIDGWYYDGYRPADSNVGEVRPDHSRWTIGDGAGSDTAYLVKFFPGKTSTEYAALKAANGNAADPIDENAPTGQEVYAPNTFNVGNTEQFKTAMNTIKATGDGEYVINIVRDFELAGSTRKQNNLMPEAGQTVTIWGNGHTIAYQSATSTQLALGSAGGVLNLGKSDGSDNLTITLHGQSTPNPLIVAFSGGTVNMYDGVTLADNVNHTGIPGGAVGLQNGTFNMYGGLISNCTSLNIPRGGAVSIQAGTFNMTGGTIEGCSEVRKADYHGFGGAVMVGDLAMGAGQFNMSDNAIIKNCSAEQGGGVYVWSGAMTMSGNALIDGCKALNSDGDGGFGGGVYVAKGGTFTMNGGQLAHNEALYGGGVYSIGTAAVTAVSNNTASTAGDDIYNDGTITLAPAADQNGVLESTGKAIDGWYYDGRRATDDTDEAGKVVKDRTRWSVSGNAAIADDVDPQPLVPQIIPTIGFTVKVNPVQPVTNLPLNASLAMLAAMPLSDGAQVLASTEGTDEETTATPSNYVREFTNTDAATTEPMALKAAHGDTTDDAGRTSSDDINVLWENEDGTILFEEDDVKPSDVPPADEYEELSGHENPVKAADEDYTYEFDGWTRSTDAAGDVIYTAEYRAIPRDDDPTDPVDPTDPNDPTEPINPTDPTEPTNPTTPDEPTVPNDPVTPAEPTVPTDPVEVPVTTAITTTTEPEASSSEVAQTTVTEARQTTLSTKTIAQTGDESLLVAAVLAAVALVSGAGALYARRNAR